MPTDTNTETVSRLSAQDLLTDQALEGRQEDAFNHWAIARRLADLVSEALPPLNIALFGAWGSGKSSMVELLRAALRSRGSRATVVRYDAWKYGGESLQRNFITHAATELGFPESDAPEFHRGLYERKRTTDVDITQLGWRNLGTIGIFVAIFACFLAAFAALAGLASVLTEEDFGGEVARDLPRFLAPTGVVAVVVAIAKGVLDGAKAETEQSQPATDEQFARSFDDLRQRALKRTGSDRLVFFIDELDRCAPDDVVTTLVAIRTFLDAPGCVFVVAADRDVLERALVADRRRVVPLNLENPYYTSASEFLDKIFAHQILLPPLRARRLTRFARDLVVDRGGVWGDLTTAEPGGAVLDRTMYALIPSHVRSPRRVKVLLNNFATNSRIAEARGVDRVARALEIAKMTVLQTEFPLIGADLHLEPRLPTFLFDPPEAPSQRLDALLRKHWSGEQKDGVVTDVAFEEEDDVEPNGATEVARTAQVQAQQLQRYLERLDALGVPEIGRDLLYLEAAGAAVDLDDAALGEVLETYATESPGRVVDAVNDVDMDDRAKAVAVLGDMLEQEFGTEQANVMTALLGCVGILDDAGIAKAAEPVADRVTVAVPGHLAVVDAHVSAVLRLGLAVRHEGLIASALDAPSALIEPGLDTVVPFLDQLLGESRSRVTSALATSLSTSVGPFAAAIGALNAATAIELINDEAIQEALGARLADAETAEASAELLYDALDRPEPDAAVVTAVQHKLLLRRATYPVVRRRFAWTDDLIDDTATRARHAVLALDWSPPEDWSVWRRWLGDGEDLGGDSTFARYAIVRVLKSGAASDEEAVRTDANDMLRLIAPMVRSLEGKEAAAVFEAAEELLDANNWWLSEAARGRQETLHVLVRSMVVDDAALGSALLDHLLKDLRRPLDAGPVQVAANATSVVTTMPAANSGQTLIGLRSMGVVLGPKRAAVLYQAWSTLGTDDNQRELLRARVALAAVAHAGGEPLDPSRPTSEDLKPVLGTSDWSRAVVPQWLALEPPVGEVVDVASRFRQPSAADEQAIDDWMSIQSVADRTAFVVAMAERAPTALRWARVAGRHGIDEEEAVPAIGKQLKDLPRHGQRERLVEFLLVLNLGRAGQRAAADIIVWMLRQRTKVDFRMASKLSAVLRRGSGAGAMLTSEFKDAIAAMGVTVPAGSARDLEEAGIRLPKRSFTEAARRQLKRFRGQ